MIELNQLKYIFHNHLYLKKDFQLWFFAVVHKKQSASAFSYALNSKETN